MLPLRDRLPTRSTPYVTYLILAVNIACFLWERTLIAVGVPPEILVFDWGLVPARFLASPVADSVTILSSMFLHDPSGWMHLGGNMLFLWIFGDNVEDALGHARYAAFYVLSGVVAAAAQVFVDPGSIIPMVGASGAISGVLAAYATLYPRSPILLLNPILPLWLFLGVTFELPAWLVILEYFIVNLLNGLGSLGQRGGGVAFFAHLGGFVGGLFLVRALLAGRIRAEQERLRAFRTARPLPPQRARRPQTRSPRSPWEW